MLLGEVQSKIEHVAGVPLLPEVQQQFLQLFLAKGALATTAIEGNTLSEEEALRHLAGELELPPSKEYLKQELDNIIQACNAIGQSMLQGDPDHLSAERIATYNRQVLASLPLAEEVTPGRLRRHDVGVDRYRGVPHSELEMLVGRLSGWLDQAFEPPDDREKVAFGVVKAIIAHLYLAWIHPFGDGNGRTARLMEFHILLAAGVPNIAAHLLSNYYNQTRTEYYRQLDRASRANDPLPFLEYALQGFAEELQQQIETIRAQQLQVHWIYHIHDQFSSKDSLVARRRRRLAIDLARRAELVSFDEMRHLSPRVAEAYAGKTERVVRRDLNTLEAMDLVIQTDAGVLANFQKALAFLPATRTVAAS